MRRLRAGFALAITAVVLCGAHGGNAQSLNYQTFLLGDRALGMGGAFTGLADDPSGIYYNPAGLARLGVVSASGSLSVSLFEDYTVRDGFGSSIGTADLAHDGSFSVPLFVGIVHKPGSSDTSAPRRRHAFGASIIHPGFLDRGYDAVVSDPATGESASLEVSTTDRSNWYGGSYAISLSDDWSLGVSGFLAYRRFSHAETEISVGLSDAAGGTSTFFARQSRASIDTTHLVIRLGALWDINWRWRVGLMLQPPGIRFEGSSAVRERVSRVDLSGATPSATFLSSSQEDLDSELPVPWELRLGASSAIADRVVMALDLSVYGPSGSGSDPRVLIGQPAADPETGFVPSAGRLVATRAYSRPVVNASLGVETFLADIFVVRGGLFTDFSPNPPVEGSRETYRPPDVDYYGASLSVGLHSDEYDISVGAAGLLGRGQAFRLSPQRSEEGQPDYLVADVRAHAFYFYLSGAITAVSRVAETASEEIFEDQEIFEE